MPVDFKRRFLFVHIPKTAGSSVESLFHLQRKENFFSQVHPVLQHLTPRKLQAYLPPEVWKIFFKFTIVRNPFDRMVSEYHWNPNNHDKQSFVEFLRRVREVVRRGQYDEDLYADHLIPQVDYFQGIEYDLVLRFEHLHSDFQLLLQRLQLDPAHYKLPHVNRSERDKRGYRQYYNEETRALVAEIYADDIAKFGYEF